MTQEENTSVDARQVKTMKISKKRGMTDTIAITSVTSPAGQPSHTDISCMHVPSVQGFRQN